MALPRSLPVRVSVFCAGDGSAAHQPGESEGLAQGGLSGRREAHQRTEGHHLQDGRTGEPAARGAAFAGLGFLNL